MNTCSGREKSKNFLTLLDSRRSSTIVMGKLTSNLKQKQTSGTMRENQFKKFTTSKNVNVNFCLPEFSATKIVTWKCHVSESTIGIYDMIIRRYPLTPLGQDLFLKTALLAAKDHMKDFWHLWLTQKATTLNM